jgi:hypothetical protein
LKVRQVSAIKIKRIHVNYFSQSAGHWWLEIGDPADSGSESYGWWPEDSLRSLFDCFKGVAGVLNDGLHGQAPPRDPHHGEKAEEEFSPLVPLNDQRTDDEIADCLRNFFSNYKGTWRWLIGWGQNCHTFQLEALAHCGLEQPKHVRRMK